jgi:hypothetical protein
VELDGTIILSSVAKRQDLDRQIAGGHCESVALYTPSKAGRKSLPAKRRQAAGRRRPGAGRDANKSARLASQAIAAGIATKPDKCVGRKRRSQG